MSQRRRAPKRRVSDVVREGVYPNVMWRHKLECGHWELRKRRSPAGRVGCTTCLGRVVDAELGIVSMEDMDAAKARFEALMANRVLESGVFDGWDFGVEAGVVEVGGQAQVVGFEITASRR